MLSAVQIWMLKKGSFVVAYVEKTGYDLRKASIVE